MKRPPLKQPGPELDAIWAEQEAKNRQIAAMLQEWWKAEHPPVKKKWKPWDAHFSKTEWDWSKYPDRWKAVNLYVESELTLDEIAKAAGVGRPCLDNWLHCKWWKKKVKELRNAMEREVKRKVRKGEYRATEKTRRRTKTELPDQPIPVDPEEV